MQKEGDNTAHEQQQILKQLGLSTAAASCYILLVAKRPLAPRPEHIAELTGLPDSTLYRALKELHTKGFVDRRSGGQHSSYKALPLTDALENFALYQRGLALPILKQQAKALTDKG